MNIDLLSSLAHPNHVQFITSDRVIKEIFEGQGLPVYGLAPRKHMHGLLLPFWKNGLGYPAWENHGQAI